MAFGERHLMTTAQQPSGAPACVEQAWFGPLGLDPKTRLEKYKERCRTVVQVLRPVLNEMSKECIHVKTDDGVVHEGWCAYLIHLHNYNDDKTDDMKQICIKVVLVDGIVRAGLVGDSKITSDADLEVLFKNDEAHLVSIYAESITDASQSRGKSLAEEFDLNCYMELFYPDKCPAIVESTIQDAKAALDAKLARHNVTLDGAPIAVHHKLKQSFTAYTAFEARNSVETETELVGTMKNAFVEVLSAPPANVTLLDIAAFHFCKIEGYVLQNTLEHFRSFTGGLKGLTESATASASSNDGPFRSELTRLLERMSEDDTWSDPSLKCAAAEHIVDAIVHYNAGCVMKKGKYLHRLSLCSIALIARQCKGGSVGEVLDNNMSSLLRRAITYAAAMKTTNTSSDAYTTAIREGPECALGIVRWLLQKLTTAEDTTAEDTSAEDTSANFVAAATKLYNALFKQQESACAPPSRLYRGASLYRRSSPPLRRSSPRRASPSRRSSPRRASPSRRSSPRRSASPSRRAASSPRRSASRWRR